MAGPYYVNDKVDSIDFIEAADLEAIESGFAQVDSDKSNKVENATSGNFAGLNDQGDLIDSGVSVVDEDDMLSNSNTKVPTQQSVKQYVDLVAGATDHLSELGGDLDDIADSVTYKKMTAPERNKLAGIEADATGDQTGAEIKLAYEGEADTNAFTDAEKNKLAGIEAGATGGDGLPDQAGHTGKYLKSDGTTASWEPVDAAPDLTGYATEAYVDTAIENAGGGTTVIEGGTTTIQGGTTNISIGPKVAHNESTMTLAPGAYKVVGGLDLSGGHSVVHAKRYTPGDIATDTKWDFDVADVAQWDGGAIESGSVRLPGTTNIVIGSLFDDPSKVSLEDGASAFEEARHHSHIIDETWSPHSGGYTSYDETLSIYYNDTVPTTPTKIRMKCGEGHDYNSMNAVVEGLTTDGQWLQLGNTTIYSSHESVINLSGGTQYTSYRLNVSGISAGYGTRFFYVKYWIIEGEKDLSVYDTTGTVTSLSSINTSIATAVNSITVAENKPTGTDLTYALSFDGKQTWTAQMGKVALEAFDFSSVTLGDTLDIQMAMSTTDTSVTPSVDQISVDMNTMGVWSHITLTPDLIDVYDNGVDSVTVTNNSASEESFKIGVETVDNSQTSVSGLFASTEYVDSAIAVATPEIRTYKTYVLKDELTIGEGELRQYLAVDCTLSNLSINLGTAASGSDLILQLKKNGVALGDPISVTADTDKLSLPLTHALVVDDYITVDVTQVGSAVAGTDLYLVFTFK